MTTESTLDAAPSAGGAAIVSARYASGDRDPYTRQRVSLSVFFLTMCAFRDAIFITGPILVFRMDGSVKSGGIYGSALLFGGMVSFLVTGVVIDRLGWRRVALVAAAMLVLANGVLAATALGLLPYQRESDIALLVAVFFCGTAFYLIPDILINHLLRENDRPAAYARSGSLFPAIALMVTAALLFGLERLFGPLALGMTIGITAMLAILGLLYISRLHDRDTRDDRPLPGPQARSASVASVLGEWLSGFRFIASDPVMRLLFIFNCCLALALAPHNVFITAILKSVFALDDGGVAVAQFTLASVEVLAAIAFPVVARRASMRALALISVAALVLGNGVAATVLFLRESATNGGIALLFVYITAHVVVFVGLTFASAWIRMVRGRSTPRTLLGRTVGAMSTASQLSGLLFSLVVSFVGAAISTHAFYIFCVAVTALVGTPMAIAVARRLAAQWVKGA
jgi:hypothetical protein